jgi:electron transport complex protein RnfD
MVFKIKKAPYLKFWKSNVSNMMFHVVLALIPAMLFSFYLYGLDAVIIVVTSIATMLFTEFLYCKVTKIEVPTYNYSTLVSAIIYALILPNDMPIVYVVIGAFFGIYVGKLIFGGLGANIFNPAGVARIFVVLSFGAHLAYNVPAIVDTVATATPLAIVKTNVLSLDVLNSYSLWDMFVGTIPGSIGETSAIAILLGAFWLIIQRVADFRKMISMVGAVAFLSAVAAVTAGMPVLDYVLMNVLSGGLLFGAVFMITDPVSAPLTAPSRIIYATLAGFLTFFIRIFGGFPEGVVLAILFMNVFTPALDYHLFSTTTFNRKWFISYGAIIVIATIITVVGVQGM